MAIIVFLVAAAISVLACIALAVSARMMEDELDNIRRQIWRDGRDDDDGY